MAVGTAVTIGSGPAFAGLLATALDKRPSSRWLLATAGAVVGCAALVRRGEAAGVVPGGILPPLVAGAARAAKLAIRPARIGGGRGESHVAVNRRETAPNGRTVTVEARYTF